MTYSIWLTFTIMATLLVMSPGPNGVIVLKTLGQHGYQSTLAVVFGLFSATFMHGLFVLFGLSALLVVVPQAFMVVKMLGALYLGYLGIKALREFLQSVNSKNSDMSEAIIEEGNTQNTQEIVQALTPQTVVGNGDKNHKMYLLKGKGRFLRVGWLAQLLNPKVSVFYLAVLPNFVDFSGVTATVDTLILTTTHASIVGGWFFIVATVSMKLLPYFKNSSIGHWLNGLAGAVMLYFSAMLLTYDTKKP